MALLDFPSTKRPRQPLVSEFSTWKTDYKQHIRQRNENHYSPDDKARAIVAVLFTGSQKRAAYATGIPQQTLSDWMNGRGITEEILDMAKHYAEELAKRFEEVLEIALDRTMENLQGGKVRQYDLNGLLRDAPNTILVLRGDPNQITAITDDEKRAKLEKIRAKIKGEIEDDVK